MDENDQDIFSQKQGDFFLIFKNGQEGLVAGLYWSDDNTKKI